MPVSCRVDDYFVLAVPGPVGGRVLGGDDHLVAILLLGHPFAEPDFRFFGLVVVACVDEVAAI